MNSGLSTHFICPAVASALVFPFALDFGAVLENEHQMVEGRDADFLYQLFEESKNLKPHMI